MNSSGGGGRIGRFGRMIGLLMLFPIAAATVPNTQTGAAAVAKHTATVWPISGLPVDTKLQVVAPPTAGGTAQGNGPSPGATALVVVRTNATGTTLASAPPGAAATVRVQLALPVIVAVPVTAPVTWQV